MSSSVEQVAKSSQVAVEGAKHTKQAAKKGSDAAVNVSSKMTDIDESVGASVKAVDQLGQRSEQINEIVKVITNIASQTNLLALNAAIEAARAGDAGMGFSVVADEVRKLAEDSAKAADRIGGLIKEILQETQQVVKNIKNEMTVVSEGKVAVDSTGVSLREILQVAESSAVMAEQISVATQQMSVGTKLVAKNFGAIASTAEESSAGIEEASASTQQITSSMQEMTDLAEGLLKTSVELKQLVSKFKVKPESRKEDIKD